MDDVKSDSKTTEQLNDETRMYVDGWNDCLDEVFAIVMDMIPQSDVESRRYARDRLVMKRRGVSGSLFPAPKN